MDASSWSPYDNQLNVEDLRVYNQSIFEKFVYTYNLNEVEATGPILTAISDSEDDSVSEEVFNSEVDPLEFGYEVSLEEPADDISASSPTWDTASNNSILL